MNIELEARTSLHSVSDPTAPHAVTAGPHAPYSTDAFKSLSAPQRKELRSVVRQCNERDSKQLEFLIKYLPIKDVRDSVLSTLWEREYLISRPANRGRLLEALQPYAHEPKVQVLAMLSLKEPDYARSYQVCAPAARLLAAHMKSPSEAIVDELLDLGRRYGKSVNDPAARIAFFLLAESPPTSYLHQRAHSEARSWYAKRLTKANPWLELLTCHRSPLGLSLLGEIVRGSVRDPHDTSALLGMVTLPFLPHEIAVIGSIIGFAAREVCKLLGQNNRMANSTALGIAAGIIITSRLMWHASRADKFNSGRNRERIEALHHLKSFTLVSDESPSAQEQTLARKALRLIGEAGRSFLQNAPVRAAAKALWSDNPSLSELKNFAQGKTTSDVSTQQA